MNNTKKGMLGGFNKMQRRIHVKLRGGLGNQLHIFAAAWVISKDLNRPIRVNGRFLAWTGSNPTRNMELDNFSWPRQARRKIIFVGSSRLLPRQFFVKKLSLKIIDMFNKSFFKATKPIDTWQNYQVIKEYARNSWKIEGHFLSLRWLVRAFELGFPTRLELKEASKQLSAMSESKFCAIHIRLTDYLQAPTLFPTLTENYYLSAVDQMRSLGVSRFVVFSDDPSELSKRYSRLMSNDFIRIADKELTPAESFYCMHTSTAIITANSTFSIFAAGFVWRNNGIVITPNVRTFADYKEDLWIPEEWIQLDHQTGRKSTK